MNDWIMPVVLGAVFYALGTARSRVIAAGRPPNKLSRGLRAYGTIWVVGEGYLMLTLRSLLDGRPAYERIAQFVIAGSLLWAAILAAVAMRRKRTDRTPGPC
jgi:hypothetical protein